MNDDDFASIIHQWGRSKRLTPSRVRSLSRSIRHGRLGGALLTVVGLGTLFVAQAFAVGAVATGASIMVVGYGLLCYRASP